MLHFNRIVYLYFILYQTCYHTVNSLLFNSGQNDLELPLTVPQIITKYGYACETHEVTTEDGFILTLFRIPSERMIRSSQVAKKKRIRRQPVLITHGFVADSGCYFFKENQSLPFLLADRGYDVWLSNLRGSIYSIKHVKYKPHEDKFWKWSWDQMAAYDLPAMLDYISSLTKEHGNILYVGHSMGSSVFFALMCEKPKYNSYVKAMFALAPVTYLENLRGLFTILLPYADLIYELLLGLHFETSQTTLIPAAKNFVRTFCKTQKFLCSLLIFSLVGFDSEQFDADKIPFYASQIPSSMSIRTLLHYVQIVRSSKFQHFDYGYTTNFQVYGQRTPPSYNISKITVPVALYWSKNDYLSNEKDTERLWSEIPHKILTYEVPYGDFNHFDFVGARDVKSLLYDKLLEDMSKFS